MKNLSSIASAFATRSRRLRNIGRTSEPFISGDFYASITDLVIEEIPLSNKAISKLKSARVLFVKSELLREFLLKYGNSISAEIIICSNSDYDFMKPLAFPKSVERVFLQNSFISDNKLIFTLPIGIENLRLSINGLPELMKSGMPWYERSKQVLVGPFSGTHPERIEFMKSIKKSKDSSVDILESRISPKNYAALMQKYRFVLCPRGNGVDTHRFWEALYRGAVPIVVKSKWSQGVRNLKLPFVEITEATETAILEGIEDYAGEIKAPSEHPALWSNYWREKLKIN